MQIFCVEMAIPALGGKFVTQYVPISHPARTSKTPRSEWADVFLSNLKDQGFVFRKEDVVFNLATWATKTGWFSAFKKHLVSLDTGEYDAKKEFLSCCPKYCEVEGQSLIDKLSAFKKWFKMPENIANDIEFKKKTQVIYIKKSRQQME